MPGQSSREIPRSGSGIPLLRRHRCYLGRRVAGYGVDVRTVVPGVTTRVLGVMMIDAKCVEMRVESAVVVDQLIVYTTVERDDRTLLSPHQRLGVAKRIRILGILYQSRIDHLIDHERR